MPETPRKPTGAEIGGVFLLLAGCAFAVSWGWWTAKAIVLLLMGDSWDACG